MNRGRLIHPELLAVIAAMGHTDSIVIADAGLPIPESVPRIDLAFTRGHPTFLEVLEAVAGELVVERATLAVEIRGQSPDLHERALPLLPEKVEYLPHEDFKRLTREAKAVVRTGETTPYGNVILHGGVDF
jgi:D-ribose pyranase